MAQAEHVIGSLRVLMDAEDDVLPDAMLHAAVYSKAMRADLPPRTILENLFKSLPSNEHWPKLRTALEGCLEQENE